MKLYNLIAITGFIEFLIGCLLQNTDLTLIGIGVIMFCVPFNINDNLKKS